MSHSVSLERRSGSSFSPIGAWAIINPGEPIRIIVYNAMRGDVEFFITDVRFPPKIFFNGRAGIAPTGGEAWLNIAAPREAGLYYLYARNDLLSAVGSHNSEKLPFKVSGEVPTPQTGTIEEGGKFFIPEAPPPPPPPPSTGLFGGLNLPDFLKDIKTGGLILLAILGVMLAGKVIGGRK